jgi:hypothetical protein
MSDDYIEPSSDSFWEVSKFKKKKKKKFLILFKNINRLDNINVP